MPMNWPKLTCLVNLRALYARVFALILLRQVELRWRRGEARRFCSSCAHDRRWFISAFDRREERLVSSAATIMRLLASTAAPTNKGEALGAFSAATLHAPPAHQHRDAPLDAGAKALALFERRRSFVDLALPASYCRHAANACGVDGALHACRYILLAEEAAIGAVRVPAHGGKARRWRLSDGAHELHLQVSLEQLILGDQTFALSARNTLWPNSTGVRTLPRLIRSVWGSKIE